jgi:hypothetical protein
MRLRPQLIVKAVGDHLPRRTVRLRLSLLYGSLFLTSGAVLLVIINVLWGRTTRTRVSVSAPAFVQILRSLAPPGPGHVKLPAGNTFQVLAPGQIRFATGATVRQQRLVANQLLGVATQQHNLDLRQLLLFSAIALAIMALIAIALGWMMAGRFLRPLRTITTTAQDISATNLHERLRLDGPNDELKELGDTFDRLLERLERSFQLQRQFVANASHELRTPLATIRASLDVAAAKPGRVPEETLSLVGSLREELDQIDRLIESFLALARAQRGPSTDEATFPLDELIAAALSSHAAAISEMGIHLEREECPVASITGNETLLSRMVDNVIDNAVKHNEPGGWVRVGTRLEGATARLLVENGGPVLDEDSVAELVQPFRRLGVERTGSDAGFGLGLSIVAAVAEAHGGRLELHALKDGGLQVAIDLPLEVRMPAGAPV